MDNVETLSVRVNKRKARPVRYHFRTSDKIIDMLSQIAEEDCVSFNVALEKLVYLEYWKRTKFKKSQIELGDLDVI